jgi:hypothetical protein
VAFLLYLETILIAPSTDGWLNFYWADNGKIFIETIFQGRTGQLFICLITPSASDTQLDQNN